MYKKENLSRILRQYGVPDDAEGREYIFRAVEVIASGGPVGPALRPLLLDEFGVEGSQFSRALYNIRRRMTRRGWTSAPVPPPNGPVKDIFFLYALAKQAEQET